MITQTRFGLFHFLLSRKKLELLIGTVLNVESQIIVFFVASGYIYNNNNTGKSSVLNNWTITSLSTSYSCANAWNTESTRNFLNT